MVPTAVDPGLRRSSGPRAADRRPRPGRSGCPSASGSPRQSRDGAAPAGAFRQPADNRVERTGRPASPPAARDPVFGGGPARRRSRSSRGPERSAVTVAAPSSAGIDRRQIVKAQRRADRQRAAGPGPLPPKRSAPAASSDQAIDRDRPRRARSATVPRIGTASPSSASTGSIPKRRVGEAARQRERGRRLPCVRPRPTGRRHSVSGPASPASAATSGTERSTVRSAAAPQPSRVPARRHPRPRAARCAPSPAARRRRPARPCRQREQRRLAPTAGDRRSRCRCGRRRRCRPASTANRGVLGPQGRQRVDRQPSGRGLRCHSRPRPGLPASAVTVSDGLEELVPSSRPVSASGLPVGLWRQGGKGRRIAGVEPPIHAPAADRPAPPVRSRRAARPPASQRPRPPISNRPGLGQHRRPRRGSAARRAAGASGSPTAAPGSAKASSVTRRPAGASPMANIGLQDAQVACPRHDRRRPIVQGTGAGDAEDDRRQPWKLGRTREPRRRPAPPARRSPRDSPPRAEIGQLGRKGRR